GSAVASAALIRSILKAAGSNHPLAIELRCWLMPSCLPIAAKQLDYADRSATRPGSQSRSLAPAAYVLSQNSRIASRGDAAFRTSIYSSANSPSLGSLLSLVGLSYTP